MAGGFDFITSRDWEWDDLDVSFNGIKSAKVQHFEAGVQADLKYVYGAHTKPLYISNGNKEFPVTITVLATDAVAIWDGAVAAGGDDITDIEIDVQGAFRPYGSRKQRTLSVLSFRIKAAVFKIGQNDPSMPVELPGMALELKIL